MRTRQSARPNAHTSAAATLRLSLVALLLCLCAAAVPAQASHVRLHRLQAAAAAAVAPQPTAARPLVVEVLMHDTLQPVSADSFRATMQEANAMNPTAILLNLSTPGGLPESAAEMAWIIERSRAPVIAYVREPGTHVAGEGLQLLEAADLRAMHPDTVLLPRIVSGGAEGGSAAPANAALQAMLQGLALRRSHGDADIDLLLGHDRVDAAEALQLGAVDAIATTEERLLGTLDGTAVHRAGGPASTGAAMGATTTLHLHEAQLVVLPMSARGHIMRALMNPDLAVLLLALGGLLIYLEVNTPGGVVPGAAGILLVLLAAYALLHMPLRWEAVLLLAGAGVLVLAEAHFQRGRIFALFAMGALVVGLRLLVRGPIAELEVNWGTALGAGIGFGGVTAGLLMLGMRARRAKVRTGAEAMLGWLAITQTALAPEGEILVRGELWRARLSGSDAFLAAGESVKVERALGAVLEVAPLPSLQTN